MIDNYFHFQVSLESTLKTFQIDLVAEREDNNKKLADLQKALQEKKVSECL